jgi:hypothetical protein
MPFTISRQRRNLSIRLHTRRRDLLRRGRPLISPPASSSWLRNRVSHRNPPSRTRCGGHRSGVHKAPHLREHPTPPLSAWSSRDRLACLAVDGAVTVRARGEVGSGIGGVVTTILFVDACGCACAAGELEFAEVPGAEKHHLTGSAPCCLVATITLASEAAIVVACSDAVLQAASSSGCDCSAAGHGADPGEGEACHPKVEKGGLPGRGGRCPLGRPFLAPVGPFFLAPHGCWP